MAQLFKNNAYSALAASLTNIATTLTVTSGHGDRFPVIAAPDFMLLTLQDASNNIEVVRVTARASGADSMTITRAQDGTTARAWNLDDVVELRLTAFALNPLSLLEGAATAAAIRSAIGAVDGPAASADSEIALFSGAGGKTIKRATGTGVLKMTSGVLGTAESGTDFKTVNGQSILGSGNLEVQGFTLAQAHATALSF